ncbi:magnesium/cobalt transporter CorA [Marinactinospora rubrisoli]|uniref:Magnesium transport protein CorA n=1 Tax=Marinactinospora rubrisoli TaxID=2715399 RepID=A0ABW2KFL7_9ACTN
MTECAIYRANDRIEVDGDISDALDAALAEDPEAFCWIDLHEPTEEEFALASRELELHPLAVEDVLSAHQRPKLERYGTAVLVVLKSLSYDAENRDVTGGEIMVCLGRNYVVTVRHGDVDPLKTVRRRLEAEPELLRFGSPVVLYGVLDAVVDDYVDIVDAVQEEVTRMEERVFVEQARRLAGEIYAFKREVMEIHSAAQPMMLVTGAVAAGDTVRVTPEARPYFRDVADHSTQVAARAEAINELLGQVMSAYLAQVGVQQNEDGRRISAWAAIMAIPTMVAGVYGMNFENMPELHTRWGYPVALFFILSACAVLYALFKRSRWL